MRSKLNAMVLVYAPNLNCSMWVDYGGMIDEETGEDIPMSNAEMIEELRKGVREGRYIGWRLIRIEKEVMGNETAPIDVKDQVSADDLQAELDRVCKEAGKLQAEANKFHDVMDCLRKMQMKHGACKPRSRRACAHCNAKERLDAILSEYKGRPVRIA